MADPQQRADAAAAGARDALAWRALPLAAAIAFTALAWDAARVETPTVDEFAHVPAGVAAWRQGRTDLYRSNPPLPKLLLAAPLALDDAVAAPLSLEPAMGWGPWEYGQRFQNANRERYLALMPRARAVAIAFALSAAALVWRWAREAFGVRAAAVVAALFLLCPNVLAHGHLATIDMAALATALASVYALRWAYRRPSGWRLAAAGGAFGLALATKFSAVLLAPAIALLVAWRRVREHGAGLATTRRAVADLAWIAAAALLVVNASVAFEGSLTPLGDLPLRSGFARSLQDALPAQLPVPLPREWALGFDGAMEIQEHGEFGSYLLGRWSADGFWYYDAVALGVKLPLAILALLACAPLFWRGAGIARGEALWILAPLAALLLGFAGGSNLNIGLRHVLPAVPFLFLLLGPVFRPRAAPLARRTQTAIAAIALALAARNAAALHPSHLTFFNALAGGPERGSEWLLDSNLDWGQDLYRVRDAAAAIDPSAPLYLLYFGHVDPALYGVRYEILPATPVEGVVAVSENFLGGYPYLTIAPDGSMVGVAGDTAAWLRGRTPAARIGSIVLFDTRTAQARPASDAR